MCPDSRSAAVQRQPPGPRCVDWPWCAWSTGGRRWSAADFPEPDPGRCSPAVPRHTNPTRGRTVQQSAEGRNDKM